MKQKNAPNTPVQAIPKANNAQKAKLANALRDNLKRRKEAPRPAKPAPSPKNG